MSIPRAVALLTLALIPAAAYGDVTRSLVTVPTRSGVTQQFLFVTPDAPVANLVAVRGFGTYPGAIHNGGAEPLFVTLLAKSRFAVALVDAPSDHLSDFIIPAAFRRSADHAADILEVIRYMQKRADVPIWLDSESNGTISVVSLAILLPSELRLGAIMGSSTTTGDNSLLLMPLGSLRLPTLLIAHTLDACFLSPPGNQPLLLAALTSVPAKDLIFLSGGVLNGDPCDKGYHEFEGLDAELTAAIASFVDKYNGLLGGGPLSPNYQGLWWATGGTEAFWGINFAHAGDQVFGTWYTYDTSGKAWWLSMLAGRTTPSSNEYTGDINVDVGPPFNNFVGSATHTKVGTGTLTFTDASNGTFHYDLNAGTGGSPVPVSQTKAIELYNLGTGPQPTCTFSPTANLALATNYQDLWWVANAAEDGWGINFAHQGDSVFLTWYTYDGSGAPLWLSALTQRQGATNVYIGSLLRTSGPRFDNYKASDVVMPTPVVGTATLTFANGNSATFAYTTTGNTGLPAVTNQVKSIVRFPFSATGGTICH